MDKALKDRLRPIAIQIEDYRSKPYQDIYGNITVGIGHNLSANPVADDIITRWFDEDVSYFYDKLARNFPWFSNLTDDCQMALIYMTFNLGWEKFLGFKKFIGALSQDDVPTALHELKSSRYYSQVPRGARAIYNALNDGTFRVIE